jgi:hypothetical protein
MKHIKTYEAKKEKKYIKSVSLQDLVGEHMLSGVDMDTAKSKGHYESYDAAVMRFILDGKTYVATEDPEDGYRSCLDNIRVYDNYEVKNTFPEHKVIGEMNDEIVKFIDAGTQEVVLEIGTDYSDSYYPTCVLSFIPENLELNRVTKQYNL